MNHQSKKVLVAPLDWGLGHATRCIPIIKLLIDKGCQVSIASSGNALKLLRSEFGALSWFELPTYNAVYSRRTPFMLNVFLQLPKFLLVIHKEKKEIKRIINKNNFDLIISDNRYGCRHNKIKSVFVCHQINIIMPFGLKWVSSIVNYFNHRWIKRFNACWIPDNPIDSLTAHLSNPSLRNCIFIGILSRFTKRGFSKMTSPVTVILSGPEPQRSILENKIIDQLKNIDLPCILVRGVVDNASQKSIEKNVTLFNHLVSDELQSLIEESSVVICRSGYSSIMDMAMLGKRVIFIPTPGQTEQEYLGSRIKARNIAPCYSQDKFDLRLALSEIENYAGFEGWDSQTNLLHKAINHVLG